MRQCRRQNIPMGGSLVKEKAKAFAKELGIEFSASEGWLTNFKKRNGGAQSDAEIVALDHNNTESDEDEWEELTPVTLSKAKVSLNKLRNLFLQNHVDADILQASFVLENLLTNCFQDISVAAVAEWYRYRIVTCLVTSSSPVPLKTRRVGQRCTINLSRAETSSRWCGVVVRRGGAISVVVHIT
ncbi:uncharacterized protein TNCV_3608451 [Trichonephila clavipes]|nr:uncharacterized protein TNCV_3608451 [Trichonephila clavipes]